MRSESHKAWALAHHDKIRLDNRAWKKAHPEQTKASKRAWKRRFSAKTKLDVLSHYGPEGKLQCSWPDCPVTDVDMLSIDHIANDGAEHRRKHGGRGHYGGYMMYRDLQRQGYPEGFQTLCHNHQWKKQLMLRTEETL